MGSQKHGDRGHFFFRLKDSQPYNLKVIYHIRSKKGQRFYFTLPLTINLSSLIVHRSSFHNLKTYKLKNLKLTLHRSSHILLAVLDIDTFGWNTV